jgi:hypothetical protein
MVMRPGRRMARRRTIATVAVAGGVAHHAAKKGAEAGAQQAYEAEAEPQQAYEQAPPPPAAPAELDYAAELQQLAQLHEQGILTDEEFEAKKSQILGI